MDTTRANPGKVDDPYGSKHCCHAPEGASYPVDSAWKLREIDALSIFA
jgi:hypothetical protein